jgi:hypothetical protein
MAQQHYRDNRLKISDQLIQLDIENLFGVTKRSVQPAKHKPPVSLIN